MMPPIEDVVTLRPEGTRHLAPTWRKEMHQTCAEVLVAFWDRSCLCLSDLARALPAPQHSLHGRLKRLGRWLDNPHLDELAWISAPFHPVVDPSRREEKFGGR